MADYGWRGAPPAADPNRGLRTAGTVALWVWVVLALLPVLGCVGCLGLCVAGAFTSSDGAS